MTNEQFQQWLKKVPRRPLVMGVINVTPDSFSDGGRFADATNAIAHARQLVADGADLLDIGGESTQPGAKPVEADEQIRRVVPVIRALAKENIPVTISIDTTKSAVAQAALDAGAHLVNDISGARDDERMLPLVASRGVPIVLMHMQGTPQTMQIDPRYSDVVREVSAFLTARIRAALDAGIARENILLDPGIGFGKKIEHNLTLIRDSGKIAQAMAGHPMVVGASRKGFIGAITGEPEPRNRLFGTAATTAWFAANGASIIRVHDVKPMKQVVLMTRAIARASAEPE
jgi:dihydropteroate synthase